MSMTPRRLGDHEGNENVLIAMEFYPVRDPYRAIVRMGGCGLWPDPYFPRFPS
jgi:hypothetical protein